MPDAIGLALAYLGKRERTEAEVRARLQKAGCAQSEIDDAIDELKVLGQLDDARFARLFVQDRRELDGWGQERISRRLRELGIERELVEQTCAAEPAAELDRAVELLARRFPLASAAAASGETGAAGEGDERARERAFGVLIRKGYETEIAADAVRRWGRDRR